MPIAWTVRTAKDSELPDFPWAASFLHSYASAITVKYEKHWRHDHAARNDARSCSQALSAAEHSFSIARAGDDSPDWLSYFDEAYLSARIAQCFRDLGHGRHGVEYARRSLDMNNAYVRGRAFNLALLGTALAQEGDAEQAIAAGIAATELAMQLQSYRSVRYILDLKRRIAPLTSSNSAREFNDRVGELARARTEPR